MYFDIHVCNDYVRSLPTHKREAGTEEILLCTKHADRYALRPEGATVVSRQVLPRDPYTPLNEWVPDTEQQEALPAAPVGSPPPEQLRDAADALTDLDAIPLGSLVIFKPSRAYQVQLLAHVRGKNVIHNHVAIATSEEKHLPWACVDRKEPFWVPLNEISPVDEAVLEEARGSTRYGLAGLTICGYPAYMRHVVHNKHTEEPMIDLKYGDVVRIYYLSFFSEYSLVERYLRIP